MDLQTHERISYTGKTKSQKTTFKRLIEKQNLQKNYLKII